MPHVSYINVESEYLQRCFHKVVHSFKDLTGHHIYLKQRRIRGKNEATMMARPFVDFRLFFRRRRAYVVISRFNLATGGGQPLEELSEDVITGWFAHEIGHIMDYYDRTFLGLLKFLIGYLFFGHFRVGAERQADLYAINAGFGRQIMETKNFILEDAHISEEYLSRINRYYLSPDEVEGLVVAQEKDTGMKKKKKDLLKEVSELPPRLNL